MAAEAFGALLGIGEGIFDKVYNYWRDQQADYRADRDFDYQKHLQQEVFQREDTAVQRRMADLQAAGLNPNLAAGSAASAGAVVGRSNTPTTNYGSTGQLGAALDMAQHVAQLRAQREQNKILGNQERESAARAALAENASTLDTINLVYQLGLDPAIWIGKDDKLHAGWYNSDEFFQKFEASPILQELKWQNQNNKNSAFLLQKDADYYNTDKVFQYIGEGARSIGNLTGGVGSLGSAYRNFNYINKYPQRR